MQVRPGFRGGCVGSKASMIMYKEHLDRINTCLDALQDGAQTDTEIEDLFGKG